MSSEEYLLDPEVPVYEFTDDYGNLCQRLVAPPGDFSLSTAARIRTDAEVDEEPGGCFVESQNLPDSVFKYLLPSRYCEAERFNAMAQELTAGSAPGYDQVAAIEHWLRSTFRFEPGSSYTSLSAVEVNQQGTAVCRDFAHLGIALCRALGIPARIVVGYLYGLEPMEFHAWFEAYVAHRWFTFDPTQPVKRGGYVVIGYGRDAADVAIYTQFGPPVHPVEHRVSVALA
ncbi:MAG: transglutaminase-like domain-containing protein [Pseudohaliea sp.]